MRTHIDGLVLVEPLLDVLDALDRMRSGTTSDAADGTPAMIRALAGFVQGARAPVDEVEIAPLLLSAVGLTRHAWAPFASVEVRQPFKAPRVRASGRQVGLACVHGVLDTARSIGERQGCQPAAPGHIVVHAVRHADRVKVTFETDGFRQVLELPAAP